MRNPISTWGSRLLMVIFIIFLCRTGQFGRILAVLFCALVLCFAIIPEMVRWNQEVKARKIDDASRKELKGKAD